VPLPFVALLTFVAVALIVAGAFLFLRDLIFGGRRAAPVGVRRLPVGEPRPAKGPIQRLDRGFDQMVLETGWGLSGPGGVLFLLFFGLLLGGAFWVWTEEPMVSLVGALVGMGVALSILMVKRRKRMRSIQDQFPDVLDLLSRAIHAGESLEQAVDLAGRKAAEPLGTEFRRCARQLDMGLAVPAVLRGLARRIQLTEVRIFTTTLSVHRNTGGNLALTLERMASVIRERLAYKRQLRATTGAGRFSTMLVAVIGPLLFAYLFLFQRDYVGSMLEQPLGQSLLAVAIVLEIIGLAWVLRLNKSDL
jgi:tight adherence protein B